MRRRVLGTILAITALAVSAFGVPLGVVVYTNYQSAARLELQREAAAAATVVPNSFRTGSDSVEFPTDDPDTVIGLYDTTGSLVAGSGPESADPIVKQAAGGQPADGISQGEIVAATPVTSDEQVIGVIRTARPEATVRHEILEAWGLMAALGAVVIGGAALVARWQASRLTRPLEQLTGAAQRLGGGDFTVHTERTGMVEIDDAGVALERTADRLGSMIDRERRFSSDVSHQLRTPLTALRLDLDNALTTPGVDITIAIQDAFGAIDRMEATIDDLIALRRDTIGDEALDLGALLSEIEGTWHGPLAEQGRPLRVLGARATTTVEVSGAAVRQIVAVLVANAAEHGEGTVWVRARVDDGHLHVEVADEGPGIGEDPDLVFARRADRSGDRGIGLPLARSLATAEGGRLDYHADPRPTFIVTVPFRSAP